MVFEFHSYYKGFTLIEILVVVAIIVLLLAIMLPSLSAAREQARSAVCGQHLRQVGIAGVSYSTINQGWLVGSPNTSGNGARPGFSAGDYTDTYDPENYPALHVFDWASPLLHLVGIKPPVVAKQRYAVAVGDIFSCPSNQRRAGPVNFPALINLIPADARAPSYATSRYFLMVGESTKNGEVCGKLWWSDDCVPANYVPKLERIQRPEGKAFLADAHVVSRPQGQISNANWGFTSQGAWRKLCNDGPVNYRGSFLRDEIWRHREAINILAFDGHIERQAEAESMTHNGFGEKARRVNWWFPSGTDTDKLSSGHSSEPALIVP
jgi:prepilin-type N-terminal cleavage/methylation domain-containing protein/prepilin-type processing-associated H-X9-DG protein